MGQPEESSRYLNRAKSKAPHDPEVLRAVAGQFRDEGKYDEAISTLQSIPTKTSDIQAELAYTYGLAGKQQESAALYSRLAKTAKGNIGFNLSAAQAWANAGRPEEAQQFLDAAKHIDANHYRLHALLAGIADSENRTSDAEQEYKTALDNLPPTVAEGPLYPIELRLNLYELYTREGDETSAKDQIGAAFLAIQHANVPDGARSEMLRLRATIESASGDLESANRDLKEALALSPTMSTR
jgi:tetratricopeptide (TPR) repeat protein